jgi:hypothetical protein
MTGFEVKISLIDDQTVKYISANKTEFDSRIILDELTKKMLERLCYWVGLEHTPYERPDLELLGNILYQILFGPNRKQSLREAFEKDYALFCETYKDKDEDRFRVTLELHENANQLAQFPWEFLFMPPEGQGANNAPPMDGGFFLAGEKTQLILTRFVPKVPPALEVRTDQPLRILVIFSHPKELGNIDSDMTRQVIKDIEKLEELEHIEVRVEENKTHTELYTLINCKVNPADAGKPAKDRTGFKPDIVHFIGHGKPGHLALIRNKEDIEADEDRSLERREANWCDSKQVLALFANHMPRVVFLHACQSAHPDSLKGFSSLARELVYARVPIVIAMQYPIINRDAALFARTFYGKIRDGALIDEAVRAGREALGQTQDNKKSFGDRRFGTPVVYLQQESQRAIIKVPAAMKVSGTGRTESAKFDADQLVSCPNPRCPSHPDGKIPLGSIVCVSCGLDLMVCPNCLSTKQQPHLMLKKGLCGYCAYRAPESQFVRAPAQAEAAPATPPQPSSPQTGAPPPDTA